MPRFKARIAGSTVDFGKTTKGFIQYLVRAGETITPYAVNKLAAACQEFLEVEDWDWPRGARFTAMNLNTGKSIRASGAYASGFKGGDAMHPWYTGNLHDSMAASVMEGTQIRAIRYMTPGAIVLQHHNGQVIDGASMARDAANRATHTFGRGGALGSTLRAVLTIGVPYAAELNEKENHQGYIEYFEKEFMTSVLGALRDLPKKSFKLK